VVDRTELPNNDVWEDALLELREFEVADGALLKEWITGPIELLTWAGPSFTWPLGDAQLAAYAADSVAGRRLSWTAVESATGEAIGHVSLRIGDVRSPDEGARTETILSDPRSLASGRLGRVLVAPAARGRGYATVMMQKVLQLAFGGLGLERVELGVFAHNMGAVRLYERLGFKRDSVLTNVEQVDGESWSALQMSLQKPAPQADLTQ
jgi:RimJ/RimL family protein N-acetyltransferase